jgi:hypothetical protein
MTNNRILDETLNFICGGDTQQSNEPDQIESSDGIDEQNFTLKKTSRELIILYKLIYVDTNIFDADEELDDILENPNLQQIKNRGAEETLVFREKDATFTGIRIAPGEGKIPVPLHRDLNAEVLSFPTIYGGVERKFHHNVKVTYTDIAKSEIRRYDRRACRPSKLLYSFKRSFNEKVYQAVQVCMRKTCKNSPITAGNIKTPGFLESKVVNKRQSRSVLKLHLLIIVLLYPIDLIRKDDGYAVFKNLRSSPSYWKEQTKKVLSMVRQYGKCTFFITLSAAETKWSELLVNFKFI